MKHFYQKTEYTCGPACMHIILHSLNKNFSEEKLAKLMHTSPTGKHGTHHNEFPKLAEKLKLKHTIGQKSSTFRELKKAISQGYKIVVCYFDRRLQEGHYAVVKRIDKKRIYLLDPTSGPNESYSIAHFRKIWHGYHTYRGWFFGIKK